MTPHNATNKQSDAIQRETPIALMALGNATVMRFRNAKRAIGFSNKHAMQIQRAMPKSANVHNLTSLKPNAAIQSISSLVDANPTT